MNTAVGEIYAKVLNQTKAELGYREWTTTTTKGSAWLDRVEAGNLVPVWRRLGDELEHRWISPEEQIKRTRDRFGYEYLRVQGWNAEGYALVASPAGQLVFAHQLPGFVELLDRTHELAA